ncbi:MAG: iron-containing alcohol dehydrogenase [Chloroflexi bacterium]|nr:iron-containing alcohol dehydrogenase [Chloroflexota bacterium]
METQNELDLRKFVAPEFVFGAGARHLAGRYARNFGARKVFVVSDPGVIQAGWTDQVTRSLDAQNLPYTVFSQVTSNPRAEEVMAGVQAYQNERCNVIVAVGGGSPMDCAKGIGIASANKRHVLQFEGVDQVPVPGPPLICIPTTAGSSADVSQFAIITDLERKVKIAIVSKTVVPDVALIDPVTTTTMDAELTACTGMDALAHAIESFVSNAHSPITDLHAMEAIRLVADNLLAVIAKPEDVGLRSQMMLGSLYAGLAFSNASLGAVHAMAHSLGGFLDFPHGKTNAILLEHVIGFNFDTVIDRYVRIGQAMGLDLKRGGERETLLEAIRRLGQAVGVDQTLGQIGLLRSDIPQLSRKAMQDACMVTNPRRPTQQEVEAIYESAF